MTGATAPTPPRLVYLVTEDWYFMSHRLPMARAARAAGYEVHVASRVDRHGEAIRAEGFTLHPLDWRRGSLNPLRLATDIARVRAVYRRVRPHLAHHVALQATLVGSLASLGLPHARLNAIAGLGYSFTTPSRRARLTGRAIGWLLRRLVNRPRTMALAQNADDAAALRAMGIADSRIAIIAGSGVDDDVLRPLPEPAGPVTAAYVGRMLDDKGVRVLVEAHRRLVARGAGIRLLLAGEPDPANPASIARAELDAWARLPDLEWLGHVEDIQDVWARAHIAVLPSRREGLPKSLLEAAACGRPIVATDVPGCRVIARDAVNALLVPPDDPEALAAALEKMARSPDMRREFGAAGRRLVEAELSAAHIGREIVALYNQLLHPEGHGTGSVPT